MWALPTSPVKPAASPASMVGSSFCVSRIRSVRSTRRVGAADSSTPLRCRWVWEWDEVRIVGGPHGPYRRVSAAAIITQHSEQLDQQRPCVPLLFAAVRRLDTLRAEQMANKQTPGYDGHCLSLSGANRWPSGWRRVSHNRVRIEGSATASAQVQTCCAARSHPLGKQVICRC